MWLTRQLYKGGAQGAPEYGQVTLNTGGVTVSGSAEWRKIQLFAPYGFAYVPPNGSQTLLLPCGDSAVCIGAVMENAGLEEGECRIYSLGGAEIVLKNNGDAVINGVTVKPDGTVRAKAFVTEG